MKKTYLLLFAICVAIITSGQPNAANYTFSTTTTGTFTDMSSGTTQLIGADQDDAASLLTNIGFDFFFQGVRYAQFSVNTNGSFRLGPTVVSNTNYDPLGQASQALITAYGADQRTHAGDGKIHYKITGAAPNRVLVVEWKNTQANFNAGGTADLTYQLRLYETTGVIESVYGNMTMSGAGAADPNSLSPQFGFSSGNALGAVGTVTAAQTGTPAPTYNSGSATPVNNTYTAGVITVLNSATDGSRRTFSFTPPTPADPTGLSFTSVSATAMTLNWADNATNEVGYAIYRSTDGISYSYISQAAANATSSIQTGLAGSVTYYWKIYAVTEGALSNFLGGSRATPMPGNITTNGTGGGLWSAAGTWSGGVIPTLDDSVTIRDGDVITIDANATVYKVTVGEGTSGILQFEPTTARTLTVSYDATVATGGTFQSAATGTQTGHVLSLGGNLTNNGTLDFSTNANTAGAIVAFTGTTNNTFGGSGPVTDIRQLTINKGGSNVNILELNPDNFTIRGSAIDNVVGGFLVMTNGTLKISGTFTYSGRMFATAAYTIPATVTIWLNNPNFTIAAQNGNAVNNGIMRLTNGTWNCGTSNASTLTGGAGASYIIEGGILNIAGRINPSTAVTYNQSGGIVNVATVGNTGSGTANGSFTLVSSATFNMTGGAINLVQASTGATPIDYINSATIVSATGTVRAGSGATVTNFNFRLRGNLPNLVIDNTTNNKTATATAQINLAGTTLINPGTTLVINGQICLMTGSTFTNNGTLTGTAAATRFYFLGGNGNTTYNGTGIVTAPLTSFDVDNEASVTIDPAVNQVVCVRFNNFSGGLINANKLTIGNGGATTAIVQLGVAGVTKAINGFDVAPVFNPGTGGVNLFYAPELAGRTTGFEVPSSRVLNQLNITNINDITIAGGDITTTSLAIGSGKIITGSNTLILGTGPTQTGTFTVSTGYIAGKFKRWIGAVTGNTDFPVGISSAKRTASINFTTAPDAGGTLTAEWVSSPAGINGLPLTEGALAVTSTSNDGYWRVVADDGLTGGAYTGTFAPTGIAEVTDVSKLVLVKRANSGSPWALAGTHVTGSGTTAAPVISRTDISGFSEFGIGGDGFTLLPVNLLAFSGQKSGSANKLHWTTASEQNNLGFEVQRSTDGVNYSTLAFVNSQATRGNGTNTISYSFIDNKLTGTNQYYRLRQVDIDNHSKYSNVIIIKGEKPNKLVIAGLFPNPATTVVNLQVSSPENNKLTITVTDINGRAVVQQMANIETGSNTIPVDISRLAGGTYVLKMVGTGNQEWAITRFVKQ